MIITIQNVNDVIPLIIKNDESFELFKKDFPEILADLMTFKTNPNCSCRGRIIKFFADKISNSPPGVLDKYIVNPQELASELKILSEKRIENNYIGRVFEIEKTPEAWIKFAKEQTVGKAFRSFSIIEKENSLMVYFL